MNILAKGKIAVEGIWNLERGRMFIKYLANGITTIRIICSILIIFTVPFSIGFYIFYTVGGITDMVDGWIARKTHMESETGAILDSIADAVFLLAAVLKLFPMIISSFPQWTLWAAASIATIRLGAYTIGALKFHRFVAVHTIANKLTGAALFCVPYFLLRADINLLSVILCVIAGFSATEELLIGMKSKSFNPNIRSILEMKKPVLK